MDEVLCAFFAARRADLPTSRAEALVEPVRSLVLRGGKRLRAALVLLGWRGAGAPLTPGAYGAAAVVELLHACALIHDDVMDGSDTRRGAPSTHRVFAERHAAASWRGDGARFGVAAAITAGDLCLVWADQLLRTCGLRADAVARARPVYDDMRALTMYGQYLDLVVQADGHPSIADALEVARAKTAACTTTGPLRFGGALADASPELLAGYEAFGDTLGVAFQLRDDLLGAFGDPALTGKPSGDDLRDGKGTVLLAEALDRLPGPAKQRLLGAIGHGTDADVQEMRDLLIGCGAREAVELRIRALGRDAARHADALPLADEAVRVELHGLVSAVVTTGPAGAPRPMQAPPRTAA